MKKSYASIDIAKIVLALFVVAIHVDPLGSQFTHLRYPIVRIAVPLFFLMSSYLFFKKLSGISERAERNRGLWNFCTRNLLLYLSWFVLLIPITIYRSGYIGKPLSYIAKDLILGFFFGSTFPASWYIMALVTATTIVYFLGRFMKNAYILTIGAALYALCCFSSNYRGVLDADGIVMQMIEAYPASIYNSFPSAVYWIAAGKLMADSECERDRLTLKVSAAVGVLMFALLFLEHFMIAQLGSSYRNDCYFSLMLLCPAIFSLVLGWRVECKYSLKMRSLSTVMYCSHVGIGTVIGYVLRKIGLSTDAAGIALCVYMMTVAGCVVVWMLIERCKSYRYLRFLKYLR